MTKLFNDQLSCILINSLVLCHHHTHLHQRLHNISCTLSHTVRQFLNGNAIWDLNIPYNLFTLYGTTHRFLARTLLLTLHRGHGAMTIVATGRLAHRQFTRAAIIIAASFCVAIWASRFFSTRLFCDFCTSRARFCCSLFWRRLGCSCSHSCCFCFTFFSFFCFSLRFRALLTLKNFAIFSLRLFTAAAALCISLTFFANPARSILCFACFCRLYSL